MIRVATFNLNNLFDRFNFHASIPDRINANATYQWRLAANRDILPPLEVVIAEEMEGASGVCWRR